MAEPVTIGGQTFIKTGDGWVDQKTKIKAPEGLLKLLNNLQSENSLSEGKKKRVRIDPSRPVIKLGKTEYVWDLNGKVWIDKKTREASNPRFSLLIEATYQSTLGSDQLQDPGTPTPSTAAAKAAMKDVLANNMFATNQKTKTSKTGSGTLPSMSNIKINSPIVQMIEKLATIDGYLKQRLNNNISSYNTRSVSTKEQSIEQGASQTDATPNLEQEKVDAEVEKANKESNGILLGAAVAAGALFISQLDPVKETFNAIVNFAKGVYDFASGIAGVFNDGLRNIVGTPESRAAEKLSTETGSSATGVTQPSAGMQQTNDQSEDSTAFSGPKQSVTSGNKASSGPNSPEEILTAFPGPKSSSKSGTSGGTTGSKGSDATRASSATAVTPSSSATAVTPSSSAATTPSSAATTPASATPAATPATTAPANGTKSTAPAQATQTGGSSPSATSNQSLSKATRLAASQVGIGESQIGNYLRQGGVGLDPRNEKWCSAFVNSTLAQVGLKGATNIANSFQKWGDNVPVSSVQEGDIVIQTRGLGPDVAGGHIGIATGVRQGNKVELIAGNTSNKVKRYFLDNNAKNGLQIRRYNPQKPYGKGAVGGAPLGGTGDSALEQAVGAGVDLTEGAIKAVGNILSAALGPMSITTGSQLQNSFNSTMSSDIGKAAREKTNAIVDSKIIESAAATIKTSSADTKASASSSQMQIAESTGDNASIQYYLTRMGFAPLDYKQAARA
jgi:uncharacterized protein (TIGR02594 family)